MGTLNNQKTVAYEKTVREIAEEIGVSKQAVFKKINRQPLSTKLEGLTSTVDGRLAVSVDGKKLKKRTKGDNRQPTFMNLPSTWLTARLTVRRLKMPIRIRS